jgi:4-hydroxy-tetrahydrodipicolinate synthase
MLREEADELDFGRVITAMVTPFDEQLQVDWSLVEPLIDYLIDVQKSDSLVICGTTGEAPTLTEEEKLRLIDISVHYARGRAKIIAGTGSNDTQHTIHFSQKVEKLGVDALLLVAPYYNKPSQEGLFQHFKAIAESVSTSIFLYNVQGRTGINIDASTTIRLSHIPNIIGTKDCADTNQLTRIVHGAKSGFVVYSGEDSMMLPALAVGCKGIISVASHVIGKEMQELVSYYLQGEVAKAAEIFGRILPVLTGVFCAPSPAPIKHALNNKGVQVGGVRLPIVKLSDSEAAFVESLI